MSEKQDGGAALLRGIGLFIVFGFLYVLGKVAVDFDRRHPEVLRLAVWEGGIILLSAVGIAAYNYKIRREAEAGLSVHGKKPDEIYIGKDKNTGEGVGADDEMRSKHTQLLGPTGEGKTSRAILPWSCSDIEAGRGFIFVDGKGDGQLLGQVYSKVRQCRREKDFHIFSLGHPERSSTFNPFIGTDAREVTERVFSALTFTDPFYRSLQYDSFHTVVSLLMNESVPVLPGVVRELLRDRDLLTQWKDRVNDAGISQDLNLLLAVPKDRFSENHAGIVSQLASFCQGTSQRLFNAENPDISLLDCIENRKIVYFQLPTMRFPHLAAATGKLVLQCLGSAISCIHDRNESPPEKLFSVYLDDFNDFIYPEFVSLLNKSRSANVGVVFSHQSMGDLGKIGPDFMKIFWESTRTKIFMRTLDPETAERIASYFGTKLSEASTERRTHSLLGPKDTGEQSVRVTQEFNFHPDLIKSLKQGEALVGLPSSSKGFHVRLGPPPQLKPSFDFPVKAHRQINFLSAAEPKIAAPPQVTRGDSASTVKGTKNEDATIPLTPIDPNKPEPKKE